MREYCVLLHILLDVISSVYVLIFFQQLYGKKKGPTVTAVETWTTARPAKGDVPSISKGGDSGSSSGGNAELCRDGKIDTIFTGPDGKAYVFKGTGL